MGNYNTTEKLEIEIDRKFLELTYYFYHNGTNKIIKIRKMFNSDNVDYNIIIERLMELSNNHSDIKEYKRRYAWEITNNLIELINKHRILNNRNKIKQLENQIALLQQNQYYQARPSAPPLDK